MGIRIRDLFDGLSEEGLEAFFKETTEEFFEPLINQYEEEETYKDVYLNKYEVYSLIKYLADSSEPMVSAPTYDYYEINAGLLLEKIKKMDGVTLEEEEE